MPIGTLGLILYVAAHTARPCEKVFVDLAYLSNPALKAGTEQTYIEEFAKSACASTNPDAIWLLAKQESNFRFIIVRENAKKPIIREGQDAVNFLARMKHHPTQLQKKSIDIGVLQYNWRWHKGAFDNDPVQALSPQQQVDYFLTSYSGEIYQRCKERWVGCYHNQSRDGRADRYQKSVLKRNNRLSMLALYYLRDQRQLLSRQEIAAIPAIHKKEIYQVFEFSKSFPLPTKLLESLSMGKGRKARALDPPGGFSG